MNWMGGKKVNIGGKRSYNITEAEWKMQKEYFKSHRGCKIPKSDKATGKDLFLGDGLFATPSEVPMISKRRRQLLEKDKTVEKEALRAGVGLFRAAKSLPTDSSVATKCNTSARSCHVSGERHRDHRFRQADRIATRHAHDSIRAHNGLDQPEQSQSLPRSIDDVPRVSEPEPIVEPVDKQIEDPPGSNDDALNQISETLGDSVNVPIGDVPHSVSDEIADIPDDTTIARVATPEPSNSFPLVLTYFVGIRGRAELARLILRCVRVDYEEQLVSIDDWQEMKPNTLMGFLPILKISHGVEIAGGRTIARYLAREHGLLFDDHWKNAQIDMIADGVEDLRSKLTPIYSDGPDKGRCKFDEIKKQHIEPFMDVYTQLLEDNGACWLVGTKLSWADLCVFDILYTLEESWDDRLLTNHSALKGLITKIAEIPSIQQYLEERTQLPV